MRPKYIQNKQMNLFYPQLSEQLNPKHSLLQLAKTIPWNTFEEKFEQHFKEGPGQPPKPIRLMVGLMMLQHIHGISDAQVVNQWAENPYWQVFCGYEEFQLELPINASSLTRWRQHLGTEGIELVLASTVQTALSAKVATPKDLTTVIADTTVMESNIRFPTDTSLLNEARAKLATLAKKHSILLRQSYARIGSRLERKAKGYAHARQFKRLKKTSKSLKTILGRVMRDVERHLTKHPQKTVFFEEMLGLAKRLIAQTRKSKNKVYSLHAPSTYCISKGKARHPYEFGHKVSLVVTHKQGLALSAQAFEKAHYDGHTLSGALSHAQEIGGVHASKVFVDKGYKGHDVQESAVYISGMRRGITQTLKKQLKRRSSIEPHIGHMKSDGKLRRNFLKGFLGACLNAVLCAIGHNLRLILRHLQDLFVLIFRFMLYKQPQHR